MSEPEVIVFLVSSDPKPKVVPVSLACDCPVMPSDFGGMDAAFFLEAERRVRRVFTEQPEILVRQFSDVLR